MMEEIITKGLEKLRISHGRVGGHSESRKSKILSNNKRKDTQTE